MTYFNDSSPTIQPIEVGSYTNYYNKTVKSNEEALYPIGTGWSWKMPSVESKDGKKYVHLADGGTYEVSGSTLKGYTWKDLTYAADTSVVVNGVTSASVLKSENSGIKDYFDSTGRLIKKTDTYGNYVQFLYTTHATYGKVLSRIENSVGNAITITYSPQEVRLTQGDRTVVYTKQASSAAENKELLTSVTDEAGRRTTYDYAIKAARFNLLGSTPNTSNPYALVTGVTHPTGAKTVYQYEPNVTKRFLGSSAVNETYRLASVSDQLIYSNGTVENKNTKTISYTGDMGSSYSTKMTFAVSILKEGVTTKFDQKKDYINSSIGAVYYNTKVTQSAGDEQRVVTKTYDEARRLPVPNQVSNQYIKAGNAAEETTSSQTYDDYGNVLTETDPNGTAKTYVYDSTTHLLKSVSEPISTTQSKKTEYTYNAQRSPVQVIIKENDQLLRQKNYDYDSYGNVITSRDKGTTGDRVQQVEYGAQYQSAFPTKLSVQTIDIDGTPQNSTQTFEYSLPLGTMTKWADGRGNITMYEYDKLGRTIKQTSPDLSTQTVTYRDLQNEVEAVDELGLKTITKFNQLGWKTDVGAVLDGVYQAKVKYGHDNAGNPIWEEDALGNRTATKYDPWSRPIELTYADLTKSTILYNDALRNKSITDSDGATQRETYDKLGRVVLNESVDAVKGNQVIQKTGYDLVGNMISEEDGNGNRTGYTYNAIGELKRVANADGQVVTYEYDFLGNLTKILYPDGKFVEKKYDTLGNVIQKTDPLGQIDKYFYDAANNLIKTINRTGQPKTFGYNNRNFLIQKSTQNSTVSYQYDLTGRRTEMIDGTGDTLYAYSELGFLKSIQLPDGKTLSYAYDSNGNRTKMTDPFGREIFYGINERYHLSTISVGSDSVAPEAEYTFNAAGQVRNTKLQNGTLLERTYDDNKLLVSQIQKNSNSAVVNHFTYQYDAVGNQTQKIENDSTYTYTYDRQNRIKTSNLFTETYSYDTRGNRESLQTDRPLELSDATYEYDEWDRLVRATTAEGAVVEYVYNGDDQMVERKEGEGITRYYYDGHDIIAEADGTNNNVALKVRYIRGNGLAALETADGKKAYYTLNGHGDVTELRDENGNLLNQYTYDIWGNVLSKTEQIENSFRYTGEFQDDVTSLIYLRARWYDPSQGRFMNEDTLEGNVNDPLSLNLYTYVSNNPLKYSDPSGHAQADSGYSYSQHPSQKYDYMLNTPAALEIGRLGTLWQIAYKAKDKKSMDSYHAQAEKVRSNACSYLPSGCSIYDINAYFVFDTSGFFVVGATATFTYVAHSTGQIHHLLSNQIMRELKNHITLKGVFDREDPAFKYRATDADAHKGYQTWHREYDKRVVRWLQDNPKATPQSFRNFLHALHQEPAIRQRIPGVNLRYKGGQGEQ
ncbi:hypothetical protein CIG75_03970 [Tumebacillus algifaecis]|uniref:Teneurin-like YD-shell domain-containing protein n=1 Tax=Tumebacillus algifaecis TaxID=1214604 RepID=A0A223CYM6_9BACL|nr:hypothetical protein CIG75_03970 [Tumebacillus algifaecis]